MTGPNMWLLHGRGKSAADVERKVFNRYSCQLKINRFTYGLEGFAAPLAVVGNGICFVAMITCFGDVFVVLGYFVLGLSASQHRGRNHPFLDLA